MSDMDGFLCISCESCRTSIALSMRTTWSYCKKQSKRTPGSCYRCGPLRCLRWLLTRQFFISYELRWRPLFRSVFQTPQSTEKITVAYRFEPRTYFQMSSEEMIHEALKSSQLCGHDRIKTYGQPLKTLHKGAFPYVSAGACICMYIKHIDAYEGTLATRIRQATDSWVPAPVALC